MQPIILTMIDREVYDEDETGNVRESTKPCVVNVTAIRCFYARKGARPGTRITFNDGGGFAVADTVEQVAGKIDSALAAQVAALAPVTVAPQVAEAPAAVQ